MLLIHKQVCSPLLAPYHFSSRPFHATLAPLRLAPDSKVNLFEEPTCHLGPLDVDPCSSPVILVCDNLLLAKGRHSHHFFSVRCFPPLSPLLKPEETLIFPPILIVYLVCGFQAQFYFKPLKHKFRYCDGKCSSCPSCSSFLVCGITNHTLRGAWLCLCWCCDPTD